MKKEKHYFLGATTGDGFVGFFDDIIDYSKKGMLYIIKGGPGTGKSSLMKKIAAHFSDMGEEVEYIHCSSDPASLDGVLLISHNIAIVDGTAPHVTECKMPGIKDKIVDVVQFIKPEVAADERTIEKAMLAKKAYYQEAYRLLSLAKKEHAKIEKFYTKNMDFKGLSRLTENLIKEIEEAIHL